VVHRIIQQILCTIDQVAAAFVKPVLEPIISGEKEFQTKSVISAIIVEVVTAATIKHVSKGVEQEHSTKQL
jgi:hypothetical protein